MLFKLKYLRRIFPHHCYSKYFIQCIQLYKKRDKENIKKTVVIYMSNSTTIRISIETKKKIN